MIRKIHYISGITLAVFIGLHLFNHFWSIFGAEEHIEMMQALRPFYRNVFIETVLLLAVVVQLFSGLKLFRASRKVAVSSFDKLHLWTGFYLAIFLVIHVSAVFVGRFLLGLDTNFYFGVAGLNSFPVNLFFIPYYALGIFSFFGHIAAVHHKKMKRTVLGLSPKGQARIIIIVGIAWTIVLFYGLTNHFEGVEIPSEYEVLTGKGS